MDSRNARRETTSGARAKETKKMKHDHLTPRQRQIRDARETAYIFRQRAAISRKNGFNYAAVIEDQEAELWETYVRELEEQSTR